VTGQIALTVAVQIQPEDPAAAAYGLLPDRGVHGAASPLDVARKADVHGQESGVISHGRRIITR
jgi:hypothetical protein